MPSNIQKKATAISARKNAGSPVSNDGFSTVTRSKTNATSDTIQSNDQPGHTCGGSAYGPTPSQVHNQASSLKSMDPEDNNNESSAQISNDLKMNNDTTPSQTTKSNSPYREALKTPIQSRLQKASVSSISRPHLEEIKNDSAKEFNNLHTIMNKQNAMMLSKLESSLDKASEQTSTSADHTVNAILAMTETLVSVFQDTNNKTALSRDEEVTTKSDNSEEETFNKAVENDNIIEEEQDYFDEEYRIGYEEYMKSNEKFRVIQEKSDFHAKIHCKTLNPIMAGIKKIQSTILRTCNKNKNKNKISNNFKLIINRILILNVLPQITLQKINHIRISSTQQLQVQSSSKISIMNFPISF
jgi:hypothetical protein